MGKKVETREECKKSTESKETEQTWWGKMTQETTTSYRRVGMKERVLSRHKSCMITTIVWDDIDELITTEVIVYMYPLTGDELYWLTISWTWLGLYKRRKRPNDNDLYNCSKISLARHIAGRVNSETYKDMC